MKSEANQNISEWRVYSWSNHECWIERNASRCGSGGIKYSIIFVVVLDSLQTTCMGGSRLDLGVSLSLPACAWDFFSMLLVKVLLHDLLHLREDTFRVNGSLKRQKPANCLRLWFTELSFARAGRKWNWIQTPEDSRTATVPYYV